MCIIDFEHVATPARDRISRVARVLARARALLRARSDVLCDLTTPRSVASRRGAYHPERAMGHTAQPPGDCLTSPSG